MSCPVTSMLLVQQCLRIAIPSQMKMASWGTYTVHMTSSMFPKWWLRRWDLRLEIRKNSDRTKFKEDIGLQFNATVGCFSDWSRSSMNRCVILEKGHTDPYISSAFRFDCFIQLFYLWDMALFINTFSFFFR